MKLPRYLLALLLLSCVGAECLSQQPAKKPPKREWREMIGTSLSGNDCKPAIGENEEGARICKGLEGYSLLLKGDEKRPQIFLVAPNGKRSQINYWDPADTGYRGMKPDLFWIIVNEPKKTISVTFRLDIEPRADYAQGDTYDVIARVRPGPVCIVGSVPSTPNAVAETVRFATSPAAFPCLGFDELQKRDWILTAYRLLNEGKIQEAQAALEEIKGYQRFIIYREIAKAQVNAGDAEGARRLLLTARAEALKMQSESLNATLGYVVTGLAEAGFYADAKLNIKLFPEEDQMGTYLGIAWTQFEKNDLEAARITYREAIDDQFKRTPQPQRDWNLSRIAESQARVKLYDEVKRTAAMIHDPNARQAAEDRLPKEPARPDQ